MIGTPKTVDKRNGTENKITLSNNTGGRSELSLILITFQ